MSTTKGLNMSRVHRTSPSPLDQVRRRHRVGMAAPVQAGGQPTRRRTLSAEDEKLLNQIMGQEQDFIDSPAFYEKNAPKKIYDDAPEIQKPDFIDSPAFYEKNA